MKILVTGGSGYIGSELCKQIHAHSYDIKNSVYQSVLMPYPYFINLSGFIRNFDVVYHLASLCIVPDSKREPMKYWENIVMGTKNVVDSCKRYDKRLIFTSTQLVEEKFRCSCCGRLNSPYAEAKLEAEKYIQENLANYAIVRLPNVYDDEDKDPYKTRLIPRLREMAKKGVVKIYPPTTDVVELIHLDKVVKELEKLKTEGTGIYRLRGEVKTIGEVAKEIANQFNAELVVTEEVRPC